MNNDILISVIIPSYNSSLFIEKSVNSALSQSHSNLEIIVVDDGSTDGTEDILQGYVRAKKIIYIKKENSGPGSARNLGIKYATGKYAALLDADDIWDGSKLQKQLDYMVKNNLDLVHTERFFINQTGEKERILNFKRNTVRLIYENYIVNSSVLIKTGILKNNPFNESMRMFAVEDYDLWLRLAFKNFKFGYLPEKLTGYRVHVNQISSAKNIDNLAYLYKKNAKENSNYFYKLLLVYKYLRLCLYKFKLKYKI